MSVNVALFFAKFPRSFSNPLQPLFLDVDTSLSCLLMLGDMSRTHAHPCGALTSFSTYTLLDVGHTTTVMVANVVRVARSSTQRRTSCQDGRTAQRNHRRGCADRNLGDVTAGSSEKNDVS